jgi:GTP-binding protein EngB required for normal cell division
LTKADKCARRDQDAQKVKWGRLLGAQEPVLFSAVTGLGVDALWERIETLLGGAPGRNDT